MQSSTNVRKAGKKLSGRGELQLTVGTVLTRKKSSI
jgi:hypothetical protein